MGVRLVIGSLILLTCLSERSSGQRTNSEADSSKQRQEASSNNIRSLAREILQASILLEGTNTDLLFDQGFTAYGDGDYKKAVASLEKVVLLQPTNFQAFLYLGYSHYYLEDFNKALKVLTEATRLEPTDAEAHYWRGASLYCLRRYDEAVKAFKKTLDLNPTHSQAWFELGCCQYYQNDYENAVKSFQKSASQEPTNYDAHIWAGYSLVKAEHFIEATSAFQRAINLQPKDYDANFWRGISLLRLWRFADATPNLEAALRAKPGDLYAREFLLGCYLATAQMGKIPSLHLTLFLAISIVLIAAYFPATGFLFYKSMIPDPRPEPRLRFALAWWGLTVAGQSVLIYAVLLLLQWPAPQALGLGLTLSFVPLMAAARIGFARQPWGTAFRWPPQVPNLRALATGLIALVVINVLNHGYMDLMVNLRGKPPPKQMILLWLGSDVRSWPFSAILGIVVVSPIAEEILCRGLLFAAIRKWLSPGWTVFVTSIVFTVVHLQPIYFPPIFALGLLLGWARHKTDGLALPIVMHSLTNGLALLLVSREAG